MRANTGVFQFAQCCGSAILPLWFLASGSAPSPSNAGTTAGFGLPQAAWRGVSRLPSRALMSVPASASSMRMSRFGLRPAATWSGVTPAQSRANASAPAASSAVTTAMASVWRTAMCRGVRPRSSRVCTSAPDSRQRVMPSGVADWRNERRPAFQSSQLGGSGSVRGEGAYWANAGGATWRRSMAAAVKAWLDEPHHRHTTSNPCSALLVRA